LHRVVKTIVKIVRKNLSILDRQFHNDGYIISRVMSGYRRGFGLVTRFIDHFNTRLVTTLNYSAIANLHNLREQITRAHAKYSQFAFISRFLVTDLNNGDSSDSVFILLPAG
jgi:hypothetical protein